MEGKLKKKDISQQGITLIALVITIIVLLILAGVSINLVVGENGVLNKAQSAVTNTEKAKLAEEVQFVLADWQTDNLVNKTPYDGRSATTPSGAVVSCIGDTILVSGDSGIYTTPLNNGEMGELAKQDGVISIQEYKAMHPIIPTGYTHTKGEWNTGFVIEETLTGDEFVWIPVVSEASYARKSDSRNWHMSEQGADDCGKDVTQYILGDKLGVSTILGTTITETQRTGETPANIPEAAVVNAAGGFYVSRYEVGMDNTVKTAKPTKIEKIDDDGNLSVAVTAKSKAGLEPIRHVSQEAALIIANGWKSGENVQSGLITGTEWDVMCNFIGWSTCDSDCTSWGNYYDVASKPTTAEIWHSGIDAGTGDGRYYWNNTVTTKPASNDTSSRMVFATGKFENANGGTTDKKNIFDVAGNVWEWTTEMPTQDATHSVIRGGGVNGIGSADLASFRSGDFSVTVSYWHVGFRAVLYVK